MLQGGKVVDRVNGAHVPELSKKTAAHSQTLAIPTSLAEEPQPTPPKEVTSIILVSIYFDNNYYNLSPVGLGNSSEEADKLIFLYGVHEGHTPGAKMWSVLCFGDFWHLRLGASPKVPITGKENFSCFPLYMCT